MDAISGSSSSIFSSSGSTSSSGSSTLSASIMAQIQQLRLQLLMQEMESVTTSESGEGATSEAVQEASEKAKEAIEAQISKLEAKLESMQSKSSSGSDSSDSSNDLSKLVPPPVDSNINGGVDKMSKFKEAVAGLSDDQKKELASVLKASVSAIKSGDFDAEKIIESVSDELKTSLEEAGVDLEGTLNDIVGDYQAGQTQKSSDYSALMGNGKSKAGKLVNMLLGVIEGTEDGSISGLTFEA